MSDERYDLVLIARGAVDDTAHVQFVLGDMPEVPSLEKIAEGEQVVGDQFEKIIGRAPEATFAYVREATETAA